MVPLSMDIKSSDAIVFQFHANTMEMQILLPSFLSRTSKNSTSMPFTIIFTHTNPTWFQNFSHYSPLSPAFPGMSCTLHSLVMVKCVFTSAMTFLSPGDFHVLNSDWLRSSNTDAQERKKYLQYLTA